MQRLEIKSRVDAKLDAWKRDLDTMRVKVDESEDEAKVAYNERVADLAREHEGLRLKVARMWEAPDDDFDTGPAEDFEKMLDDWVKRTERIKAECPK